MVSRIWDWDTAFMLGHFGWRAALGISVATLTYFLWFRRELRMLSMHPHRTGNAEGEGDEADEPEATSGVPTDARLPVPAWIVAVHILFIAWTVFNAHYPALFLGGFLFFLGFAKATAAY